MYRRLVLVQVEESLLFAISNHLAVWHQGSYPLASYLERLVAASLLAAVLRIGRRVLQCLQLLVQVFQIGLLVLQFLELPLLEEELVFDQTR